MPEMKYLDELVTRYDLEPSLTDIYVEGYRDKLFIEWFINRLSLKNINVYPISIIDVPNDRVEFLGLNIRSNRSKVATLAFEIGKLPNAQHSVMCIVDRDFEEYLPKMPNCSTLHMTDGNSLECYFFNEEALRKFIDLVLGGFPISVSIVIKSLQTILTEIFSIRLTNEILEWGMEWMPFARYIKFNGTNIFLDLNSFLTSYLQKNSKWSKRHIFNTEMSKARKKLNSDYCKCIRGHDLAEALSRIIGHFRNDRKFGNIATLEGAIFGTAEIDRLLNNLLFKKIVSFCT